MGSASLFANLVTSFLITLAVIPSIVNISNEKKLFDQPNHRKLNKFDIPTLGGVAIFIGTTLSSILFSENNLLPEWQYLFGAIILMLFVGLTDDIMELIAWKKATIQLAAALILVLLGNFRITQAYGLFSAEVFPQWFSIPVSVLFILFLINAINLIDGIDGLAGSVSLLVSLMLGTWFACSGYMSYAAICIALCGSLLAFLRFNLSNGCNKIFMGDTGSLILGTILAAIVILFIELNATAPAPFRFLHPPVLAMALLIVPVTDTLRVITIRIMKRRSPFSADKNHIHHLLIKGHFSHIQATLVLVGYTVTFTTLALLFEFTGMNITAAFIIVLVLSFFSVQGIYLIVKSRIRRRIPEGISETGTIKIIRLKPGENREDEEKEEAGQEY
jgi:UDP-N-acetylmuramyl pentapeptide phosphotransferase/UDP-N-acetylglucosamine-1-phosphate transferase